MGEDIRLSLLGRVTATIKRAVQADSGTVASGSWDECCVRPYRRYDR